MIWIPLVLAVVGLVLGGWWLILTFAWAAFVLFNVGRMLWQRWRYRNCAWTPAKDREFDRLSREL
jgi:hypothetical protein